MSWEIEYLSLVHSVITHGFRSESRAGATRSVPGALLDIPLDKGFPLLTTRKMYPMGVVGELAGFVRGAEDLATYEAFGCNYWKDNAANWEPNKGKPQSEWQIGRVYGSQWVNWQQPRGNNKPINQLANVLKSLKEDPYGRRHIVTAWNPAELDQGVLPPCHIMFQFYVREGGLCCMVYMRSVDLCVGLPSDIVLYALLTNLVAKDLGLAPKVLTFFLGDCHIYEEHVAPFTEIQVGRRPLVKTPQLILASEATTLTFTPGMISITNYDSHPAIKYKFCV